MNKPNIKFLTALLDEAFACFGRGDNQNGKAILYSFFDKMYPEFIEDAKKDKKLIYQLIIEKNQGNQVNAFAAQAMLNYLKDRGIQL